MSKERFLMLVPNGATQEQATRIREASMSQEVHHGIEWLVTQGLFDTALAKDYLEHFEHEVLGAQYGVEPRFCPFIVDACMRQYRREEIRYGEA